MTKAGVEPESEGSAIGSELHVQSNQSQSFKYYNDNGTAFKKQSVIK